MKLKINNSSLTFGELETRKQILYFVPTSYRSEVFTDIKAGEKYTISVGNIPSGESLVFRTKSPNAGDGVTICTLTAATPSYTFTATGNFRCLFVQRLKDDVSTEESFNFVIKGTDFYDSSSDVSTEITPSQNASYDISYNFSANKCYKMELQNYDGLITNVTLSSNHSTVLCRCWEGSHGIGAVMVGEAQTAVYVVNYGTIPSKIIITELKDN